MKTQSDSERSKCSRKKAGVSSVSDILVIPQKLWLNRSFSAGIRESGHRLWTAREHVVFCRYVQALIPSKQVFDTPDRVGNINLILKKIPEVLNVGPPDVWEYLESLGVDMQGVDVPEPLEARTKYMRKKRVCFHRESKYLSSSMNFAVGASPLALRVAAVMSHLKLPTRTQSEGVSKYMAGRKRRDFASAGDLAPEYVLRGSYFEDMVELVFSRMAKEPSETLTQEVWMDILNNIVLVEDYRLKQFLRVSIDWKSRKCCLCDAAAVKGSKSALKAHLFDSHDDFFDSFEDYLIGEKEAKDVISNQVLLARIVGWESTHRTRRTWTSKLPSVPDKQRLLNPIKNFLIKRKMSRADSSSSSSSDSLDASSSGSESIEERSLLSMFMQNRA